MTSSRTYDAIVIGGGHNGLVCAAMLGKSRRKVLLLEAADGLGGAARTEEFFPGYRASTAHILNRLHPDVVKGLNIDLDAVLSPLPPPPLRKGGGRSQSFRLPPPCGEG